MNQLNYNLTSAVCKDKERKIMNADINLDSFYNILQIFFSWLPNIAPCAGCNASASSFKRTGKKENLKQGLEKIFIMSLGKGPHL